MGLDVRWVGFGDDAVDALADAVADAQAGDPLQLVTVVTPSPAVAVAARRSLALRRGATVGVAFVPLAALAEQLAGGAAVGAERELAVAAVRVALAESPGPFAGIARVSALTDA